MNKEFSTVFTQSNYREAVKIYAKILVFNLAYSSPAAKGPHNALSVETERNVAQMFIRLQLKSVSTSK